MPGEPTHLVYFPYLYYSMFFLLCKPFFYLLF